MRTSQLSILIIEDEKGLARKLQRIAEEQGHQATCVIGALALEPKLILMGLAHEAVELDLGRFHLALSDYQLYRPSKKAAAAGRIKSCCDSPELVTLLVAAGVTCFGMSSLPPLNKELCDLGAKGGVMKPIMVWALEDGDFSYQNMIDEPQEVALLLAEKFEWMKANSAQANERMKQLMDEIGDEDN